MTIPEMTKTHALQEAMEEFEANKPLPLPDMSFTPSAKELEKARKDLEENEKVVTSIWSWRL